MVWSHFILASGWILFCALHSVFASLKFKQKAENRMGRQYKFYRLYYTFFALLSFAVIMIYLFNTRSYKLFVTGIYTTIPGSIISLFGLTIISICAIKYFMQTTGLNLLTEKKTKDELKITGIHQFVRHPMYSGTFIFIWGLLILFPYLSTLITDVIITTYTLVGLRFEEQKLEREFGIKYKMYKQKVPMLIPKMVKI
ncbi:MAG: methyltransferase family protein [Chitinophagales bacterium]